MTFHTYDEEVADKGVALIRDSYYGLLQSLSVKFKIGNMMFGLKEGDICEIKAILKRFSEVEEALVFGSRAMGNYKPGSDVDIALKGQKVTFRTTSAIAGVLNEDTLMPYRFDVLNYKDLKNTALLRHIDSVGQLLYEVDTEVVVHEPRAEYNRDKE